MENKIIKDIENVVNSQVDIEEKIKTLQQTKEYINQQLYLLKEEKKKNILKIYIEKYKNDVDNNYSLEYKYEVDRDFQELFALLRKVNIDGYGEFNGSLPPNTKEGYLNTFNEYGYENDVFYIRPYNWNGISYSDCSCGLDDEIDNLKLNEYEYGFHAKDCPAWDVNFCYKPTNLKISWYKYALRDAYSNQKLEKEELESILNSCIESI